MNQHTHHLEGLGGRRLITAAEHRRRMGGISEMTRWRHEKAGIGPKPVKIGNRNYYFEDEVAAHLEALAASRHGAGGNTPASAADGAPVLSQADAAAERLAAITMNSEGAPGD